MFQESVNYQASSCQANFNLLTPLRVGLLGLGTVGAGTYRVLTRNQSLIQARSGREIAITQVAVRDMARASAIVAAEVVLTTDPFAVVSHPDIDVVVEVIGGTTLAKALVLLAIQHGKHVVTANKALLAEHGAEIFAAAEARGVMVAYEGAVAVSIPIIKALREGLVANRIEWLAGIINGTSNFILSEMRSKGLSFDAALADAQRLGYAEADPGFDVGGIDAAHKLCLLAANAFGSTLQFAQVHVEGITELQVADMAYAEQLGYRVKLLGIARRTDAGLDLRVHPALVPVNHLIASVEDSMNAVMVKSDAAGITLHCGAGAGSEETASAVIADLVDVARAFDASVHQRVPHLAFQSHALVDLPVLPIAEAVGCYYLRFDLADGENEDVARGALQRLAQAGVGVQFHALLPHHHNPANSALTLITLPVRHAALLQAVQSPRTLPCVLGVTTVLRVELLV
jgi:homoserine dehydrogenase